MHSSTPIQNQHVHFQIEMCHVPMPPTGKEDVTQTLSNRAKSPINMYRLKYCIKQNAEREFKLKCAHRDVYHTKRHFNLHTQRKPTAFKQTFIQHVHSILINSNLELQR